MSKLSFAFGFLRTRIALVVMGVSLLTTVSILLYHQHASVQSMTKAQEEAAQNLVSTVVLSVESQYQSILFHKQASMEKRKTMLRTVLNLAMSQVELAYSEMQDGRLSESAAKQQAIEALKQMRYDHGVGYLWINTIDQPVSRMIMHATIPELDGKMLDAPRFNCALGRDENLFSAMVDVCLRDGRGFVDYLWPKPTEEGLTDRQPKLSYVELFKPWGWVVGTGIYIDDIERDVQQRLAAVIKELQPMFAQVKVAQTGYMFLFTGEQEMLIHPYLEGADFTKLLNPVTGNPILKDLMQAAHNPTRKLLYIWDKPPEHTGQFKYRKLAFVQPFEPMDWYIASSVYHDEMEHPALAMRGRAMMLGGVMLLLGLILSLWLSNSLSRPLLRLSIAASGVQAGGDDCGQVPVSGTVETRKLGKVLNVMLASLQGEIKERQQAEQTLKAALDEKEAATKAKSEFLARMSHELRTPLNAIIGYSEWLLNSKIIDTATAEQDQALRAIEACSEHLLGLVDEVLDQEKIEAGKIVLEDVPFSLHGMLRQIESLLAHRAAEKNIALTVAIADDVPAYVVGDTLRLRQVLVNLLGNAVKFTDVGGVTVRASIESNEDREQLHCVVQDTGIGIDESKLDHVFESFTQADQSTTRTHGGSGLGLSISKRLIELMGGEIGVTSKKSVGSTFWFKIPLQRCSEQDAAAIHDQEMSHDGTRANSSDSPADILVVDDYPVNQQMVRLHLSDAGHRVDIANNGAEALQACEQKHYDVILMDIQMPVMDGHEATRRIRSGDTSCAGSIILGATAHADPASRKACLDDGMDDVVTKPLRRQLLLGTISRLLSQRRVAEEDIRIDQDQVVWGSATHEDAAQAPLDLAVAMDVFGDADTLRSIAHQFLQNLNSQMVTMEDAVARLDLEVLRQEAHAIKGGAASLEARPLSKSAHHLEQACNRNDVDEVPERFADLRERASELNAFVDAQVSTIVGG